MIVFAVSSAMAIDYIANCWSAVLPQVDIIHVNGCFPLLLTAPYFHVMDCLLKGAVKMLKVQCIMMVLLPIREQHTCLVFVASVITLVLAR